MAVFSIELSVDELMARSRELTGIELVDEEATEPLTVLHRAYGREAQLDAEGAREITAKLLRLLSNRLRMKRDYLRHPEIHEQPLNGPLIIMGVARSGTTKLQKVLAASGDFNWLPYWQNFNWASHTGQPDEPLGERIAQAEAYCRWYNARSPETRLGHSFETHEPEEEAVLSEGCLVSPSFLGFADIPSYAQWFVSQPQRIQFDFLRDSLKYLQWQGLASPDKPWLLKSPNYNGMELEIRKIFPGALLIMAHRSPLKTLTSMCKLIQCFREAYSELKPDLAMIVEYNYLNMDAHLANRRAHPELGFVDVRFEELVACLPEVLEKIYRKAGIQLTQSSFNRMLTWERVNSMHKHGEFKYSLEEFGLSEQVIRQKMANYFELLQTLAREAL